MAADGAADDAVRSGQNVDIEVRVDLQRREHNKVQLIDSGVHEIARVIRCADLMVEVVIFQGLGRIEIKALHVEDAVDEALLVHGRDLAGDAAEGEPAVDAAVEHLLAEETRRGERSAAGAHLHGEAVIEVARRVDDIGGIAGDEQLLRVLRVARCAGHDALWVADVVRDDDVVDLVLRDGPGSVRIGDEMVRDDHDLVGIGGVRAGVAQRAAGDALVVITAVTVGIAVGVARRRAEEGDVDVQLTRADGRGAPAVRAEHDRAIHQAAGDGLRQLAAHTGRFDVRDNAVLNVADERSVNG